MTVTRWHVLGAGAIGCLFASTLQKGNCPTTLLLRPGRDADAQPGLQSVVVERNGIVTDTQMQVSGTSEAGLITHLLVTTKAQDVCEAVQSVAHRLDRSSAVLLLSNGLGFAEKLRATLTDPDYFYGTTTEGAYRQGDRYICHAGRGLTRIGRPGTTVPPTWFTHWANAVQPSTWDENIDEALWLKLAINCAINPLTALHRCTNGALSQAPLSAEVNKLCIEIMAISDAAGFANITRDLREQVAEVIQSTAENRSSMLQDVSARRGTEINYITGHLLQVAQQHGVAATHNEALYRRILELGD